MEKENSKAGSHRDLNTQKERSKARDKNEAAAMKNGTVGLWAY
jgi:hypothetical protein